MFARMILGSIAIVLLMPSLGLAQAIADWDAPCATAALPEPVRSPTMAPDSDPPVSAQVVKHRVMNPHRAPNPYRTDSLIEQPLGPGRQNPHLQSHRVIVSPNRHGSANGQASRGHQAVLDQLKHHRPMQPPVAILPESNRRPTWKTPYSYGYFGASGKRHWSLHNGYRDRMTEWRLQ